MWFQRLTFCALQGSLWTHVLGPASDFSARTLARPWYLATMEALWHPQCTMTPLRPTLTFAEMIPSCPAVLNDLLELCFQVLWCHVQKHDGFRKWQNHKMISCDWNLQSNADIWQPPIFGVTLWSHNRMAPNDWPRCAWVHHVQPDLINVVCSVSVPQILSGVIPWVVHPTVKISLITS